MVVEISVEVDACPCPDESHDPWGKHLVIKGTHGIVGQSPQEEIMYVDRNTMDDVEEDILHDAYDIFFIIMAFDRRKHIAEDSVNRSWFILELVDEEGFSRWFPFSQRIHEDFHHPVGQLTFTIKLHSLI